MGAGDAGRQTDRQIAETAYEVGREIAAQKWTLICGGLGGVMEAASKGAAENGGLTVGILPGNDRAEANRYISVVIPTGLGHARNAVIAAAADGVVAVGGKYGTLSEVALSLKMGKPVAAIGRWSGIEGVVAVSSAQEAIQCLKERFG